MSQQINVYRSLNLKSSGTGSAARILCGDSTTSASYTAGTPPIALYFTNAGTSGSTSAEPFYLKSTLTGTGQVGGRARFHTYTNVTSGDWINALKSYLEFGTSGKTTGLASSFCAEMLMPNANMGSGGAYFPLELEYVAGGSSLVTAGAGTGNHAGFIYMAQSGDADGDFDDNGFLFHLAGCTAGSGHLYDASATAATGDATLKICIGGVTKYLLVADDAS
jgi:hypothetical protein